MSDLAVREYASADAFRREWAVDDESTARTLWQLLGELDESEVLIRLPEWLADEKVGYVEGGTPTTFVGRIEGETENAIRFVGAAAAPPLARLAHRMAALRKGLENPDLDEERRAWLEDRLREKRRAFEQRDGLVGLREEWLPKSQVLDAARRAR